MSQGQSFRVLSLNLTDSISTHRHGSKITAAVRKLILRNSQPDCADLHCSFFPAFADEIMLLETRRLFSLTMLRRPARFSPVSSEFLLCFPNFLGDHLFLIFHTAYMLRLY